MKLDQFKHPREARLAVRVIALIACSAAPWHCLAQTPSTKTAPALSAGVAKNPMPKSETLHYAINWPSGLTLGEGTFTSALSGKDGAETWNFSVNLEAAVPGFTLKETAKSAATPGYCSIDIEKKWMRGKRLGDEKTTFDETKLTATRKTNKGGSSDISTPQCPKDALTFLFFLRKELAQGRLPVVQKIFYGAPYQASVVYKGTQKLHVGEENGDVDRLEATIKGPASEVTFEVFFARDTARTPIMVRVPLAMGKFTMELVR
jgi:hypothetical protein